MLLTVASMASRMEEWAPETSGCGDAGNLPEVLAERLRAETTAEYVKTLAAIFSAGAEVQFWHADWTYIVFVKLNPRIVVTRAHLCEDWLQLSTCGLISRQLGGVPKLF